MQSEILWGNPRHQGPRTLCFGKRNGTLVMLSGPRHLRGTWTINFALDWPMNRPLGATATYDHSLHIEGAVMEDAKKTAASMIGEVIEQCAPAARARRDAQTVQRLARTPRESREPREYRVRNSMD